ncbi:hypothetical protein D3C77_479920 [compost metagenome]
MSAILLSIFGLIAIDMLKPPFPLDDSDVASIRFRLGEESRPLSLPQLEGIQLDSMYHLPYYKLPNGSGQQIVIKITYLERGGDVEYTLIK